jgi:hypothetical protein
MKTLFLLFFLVLHSASIAQSLFQRHTFPYGISLQVPTNWKILEAAATQQLDTNTEAISGVPQGNNKILMAANLYMDGTEPVATARLSVRFGTTLSESEFQAMPESEFRAQSDINRASLEKSLRVVGRSLVTYSERREMLAGHLGHTSTYISAENGRKMVNTLTILFLGDRKIKLHTAYDAANDATTKATLDQIRASLNTQK